MPRNFRSWKIALRAIVHDRKIEVKFHALLARPLNAEIPFSIRAFPAQIFCALVINAK